MTAIRAFISGCTGLALSDEELRFFAETQPWGLILFKRNIGTPEQVQALTSRFREAVGRADAPVLVDQEGGRVQRLGPPHWPAYPAGAAYAGLGGAEVARLGARLIAADLRAVGITVDCAPVLDIATPTTHQAIGSRAYGADVETVVRLGRAFADGLLDGGVLPVIKHMPGQGRASVDSHVDLPVVRADLAELEAIDFRPFAALADLPIAMTAHVVYAAVDTTRPTTTSRVMIDRVIRGLIGFDGLLLSDDLSMEALQGSIGERASAVLAAGCDLALHCNGKLDEGRVVAAASPPLEGKAADRAARALALIAEATPEADGSLRARFEQMTGLAA